ncbi:F-type H+-transporting ATPase subunit gamma [Trueperella bonasi]|uniref:ATP synthase gamma chain n=1 Tax=Trueperella bonasi TaxID=312286 RepID=A0ABT9NHA7_9ACTO|nr:F0F1 ATP synthase subunit gamma [Trueperella bonasi]MDP9806755.1 F-type H+-transporting ATPase subunit gamma [Trueperella bonasi]
MAGEQRIYKQKIKATQTLEKVFSAMELIAASRVGRARERALGQDPYTRALTTSIATVAAHADEEHPLLNERTDTNRVILLIVTSDRGMAGAYSASVLREADRLREELEAQGKEPVLYVFGRRGVSHYRFRGVEIAGSWTGESDNPKGETAHLIAKEFLRLFLAEPEDGGVSELHLVYTRFENMITQKVEVRRMLPLVVVDDASELHEAPIYEFEPTPRELFDALLPMYVDQRIYSVLLLAAASELAARQQAMHAATENAQELIEDYTRLANNARQAEITTEITEIISGADSLGK